MPAIAPDFDASEVIAQLRFARKGVRHAFVPIGDDWGVRVNLDNYWSQATQEREVQSEFELHQQAAELGFAPEVGEVVHLEYGNVSYYGYTVREVETWDTAEDEAEYERIYFGQREQLQQKIWEAMNIWAGDIKRQNTGIVDGQLVYIDWGTESIQSEPDDEIFDDDEEEIS